MNEEDRLRVELKALKRRMYFMEWVQEDNVQRIESLGISYELPNYVPDEWSIYEVN